jgi:hypothetical protein
VSTGLGAHRGRATCPSLSTEGHADLVRPRFPKQLVTEGISNRRVSNRGIGDLEPSCSAADLRRLHAARPGEHVCRAPDRFRFVRPGTILPEKRPFCRLFV